MTTPVTTPVSAQPAPDVRPARLSPAQLAAGFADAAPRFTRTQALVEAERCLYCHDAPCATACPTGIDVPSFIRRIAEDNLRGAARAILQANPLGGTCARVCPTEVLCEQVCVRTTQQGKPVEIGRLQRYAVEAVMDRPVAALFTRQPTSGRRIAVVGAGPAGLACAFQLAQRGHEIVIHDARPKGGGLNEYGLAAYKMAGGFAQRELEWLMGLGGITLHSGWRLGDAAQLLSLREQFDAVVLALGLTRVAPLGIPGEAQAGVRDAVDFIAELLQTPDKSTLPVGRRVVVIGGGMTAIDAAVQSKLLGAEDVRIVYRRGPEQMGASQAEQDWAQTHGVAIHHWLAPEAIEGDGHVNAVRFARQALREGRLVAAGGHETFAADTVLRAIGQQLDTGCFEGAGLTLRAGRIVTDEDGRAAAPAGPGLADVWAGGDCRFGGRDLTVDAVEHGKRIAASIHHALSA